MKILKFILFTILGIVVVVLITALFVKKEYAVEREVVVNKPRQEVFDYIKYIKNQDNYSKWNQMDPDMKKTYQGTDGTEGFIYAWESDDQGAGKGEQEIKKIVEGERVDCEIRFKEPMESSAPVYMTTTSATNNQTLIKWGFNGKMPYPMNVMLLFMDMDEIIGDDLQTSLDKLKNVLENDI
ncbi:SRPBCC family protein [Olivibacter sp. SDN3]|uniref:SRPBCC family protein n=1 Tax=Olivibacter sp. SDN3 TaxID=2764720 RepID=UPI0016519C30|nr:SRPBCC family protein [Olivibacter sp. SDN3]QNL48296.1 SRPBCC family protein [Olivibacter sp. SDN3]